MGYTWEEVMLSIDVQDEADRERKEEQDILDKQAEEATWMAGASLGLSLLGAMLFGPVGYAAGKTLGSWGADYAFDWEEDVEKLDPGKFHTSKTEDFKRIKERESSEQTKGQAIDFVTNLATMYIQAGGLKEGFDPSIGGGDWTTFGTGGDAWTVFSDEAKIPLLGWDVPGTQLPKGQTLFTGGYQPLGTLADISKPKSPSKGKGPGRTFPVGGTKKQSLIDILGT